MTDNITPRRIEWAGPSNYTVVLDEDGVMLRPGAALEECEVDQLLAVIAEAKRTRDAKAARTPEAPPRSEWAEIRIDSAARRIEHAVRKAIDNETQPF